MPAPSSRATTPSYLEALGCGPTRFCRHGSSSSAPSWISEAHHLADLPDFNGRTPRVWTGVDTSKGFHRCRRRQQRTGESRATRDRSTLPRRHDASRRSRRSADNDLPAVVLAAVRSNTRRVQEGGKSRNRKTRVESGSDSLELHEPTFRKSPYRYHFLSSRPVSCRRVCGAHSYRFGGPGSPGSGRRPSPEARSRSISHDDQPLRAGT